jgi:hypothetical protein
VNLLDCSVVSRPAKTFPPDGTDGEGTARQPARER